MNSSGSSGNTLTGWRGLIFLLLSGWLFIMLLKTRNPLQKMTFTNNAARDLYFMLVYAGFDWRQARLIVAQAAHETANFTSKIYRENNNPFGMRFALVRKTTALREHNKYALYSDVESAVTDFKLYYAAYHYLTVYDTPESYVKALKQNGYFEAKESEYLKGVTSFYKQFYG